jgi:hypothetical protein
MYTGTLIQDLMSTVEQVERKTEQRQIDEELHEIFTMQISMQERDQILKGAA